MSKGDSEVSPKMYMKKKIYLTVRHVSFLHIFANDLKRFKNLNDFGIVFLG